MSTTVSYFFSPFISFFSSEVFVFIISFLVPSLVFAIILKFIRSLINV